MENQPLDPPPTPPPPPGPARKGEGQDSPPPVSPPLSGDETEEDFSLSDPPPEEVPATQPSKDPSTPAPRRRPPAEAPRTPPPSFPVLSDFEVLQKLGEGAMGAVYRAHQISADREVALKVMFPHIARNPKFVERFYREAQIMGLLDHPNIVQGYAVGEENGIHYLAMEYIDGRSVQKWLQLLGHFSVGDALHVTLACCHALEHAHAMDLVHRDIKPDNILITRTGEVKLADFGMVKLIADDVTLTQTGHGVGTPAYMPLEQARNAKEADGRSDIYAVGCTLYAMLTGRPPFDQPTIVELIQAKEMGMFPPARRFNPDVPQRLDLIVLKMAAKDLRQRYQTAAEVIHDLESLGLANPALSFIPSAGRPGAPAGQVPQPQAAAPVLEATTEGPAEPDWWYVRFRMPQGKVVTRKLTTQQVLELIEHKDFDLKARASRSPTGDFASLAAIREFQDSMAARVTRAAVDQETARNRSRFQKLIQAEEQRRSGREEEEEEPEKERVEVLEWKQYWPWVAGGVVGLGVLYLIIRFLVYLLKTLFIG